MSKRTTIIHPSIALAAAMTDEQRAQLAAKQVVWIGENGYQIQPYQLARWWGARKGFSGMAGGWIYDSQGRPVVQGWMGLYLKYSHLMKSHYFSAVRTHMALQIVRRGMKLGRDVTDAQIMNESGAYLVLSRSNPQVSQELRGALELLSLSYIRDLEARTPEKEREQARDTRS